MKNFKTILIFILVLIFCSCNNTGSNLVESEPFKELKRISSPDKKVEAVLVETNGGATTSFGNSVFIVTAGKKIRQGDIAYSVFTADHYQGVDIKWDTIRRLLISFDKARIFTFTNFWQTDKIDNWNYVVEIKLQCISQDGQLKESDKHPMVH